MRQTTAEAFLRAGLSNLTLPDSVVRVEMHAFMGCSFSGGLEFLSTAPPYIGDYAINSFSSISIYVPYLSQEAYKEALLPFGLDDNVTSLEITVSFEPSNGTNVSDATYYYYSVLGDLPVVSKTGYVLVGWYDNEDFNGAAYSEGTILKCRDSITLYARWSPISYTIIYSYNGGDPVSNGTFREPQNILIVTEPAGATVTYSIGSQSHDQAYTAGTPILIDKSSDIYVKAVTADGKEATAVLKIRLKCPNPTPHLEVSQTDPSKYELTFEETGSDYSIYYTKSIDDSVGTLYPADTPLLLSPEDFVIIFAKKEGWETSDKILLSVPEILKKRGLAD